MDGWKDGRTDGRTELEGGRKGGMEVCHVGMTPSRLNFTFGQFSSKMLPSEWLTRGTVRWNGFFFLL